MSGNLRVMVVDDETLARDELCHHLQQMSDVELVGQAADGVEALATVERLMPDVMFLDIQMPGLNGLEVARQLLDKDESPALVFVTAFDQHAIEAFKVEAVDYLLKPVEAGQLEQAIQKVRRRLASDRPTSAGSSVNDQLERIVKLMAERQIRREQVAIRSGERFVLVQSDDIIYASLAEESITIVTGPVSGTSNYRTLDELQARLDPEVLLAKLAWLRAHEPERFARIGTFVGLKDDVIRRLTGTIGTDVAHAAYTMLYDVGARDWSADLVEVALAGVVVGGPREGGVMAGVAGVGRCGGVAGLLALDRLALVGLEAVGEESVAGDVVEGRGHLVVSCE